MSYVHYATEDDWHTWMFHDADPAVITATDTNRNANPCGVIRSLAPAAVMEKPYRRRRYPAASVAQHVLGSRGRPHVQGAVSEMRDDP